MSNTLSIGGVPLDLSPDTAILPSFQVSDLLKPESIQSDFSPEFSVPATARNSAVLGNAAYDGSAARVPYRSMTGANLRSDGVELMPRARMFVKGFEAGQYQLQLFAGNRRFVEALGDKTLRDLDFSRFNHLWTPPNIAQRATATQYAVHGWGYELFDRGRPIDLLKVSPYELYPTLTARLIWDQMLEEAGFTASDWQSPLLDKLLVPSASMATLSEDFRRARRLRVGLGPGHEDSGNESSNRSDVVKTIPFDDDFRPIGTVPPILPTQAGVYVKKAFAGTAGLCGVFVADRTMYVRVPVARTTVRIRYSSVRLGTAQARVELHVNGQRVVKGDNVEAVDEDAYSVGVTGEKILLRPGDELSAMLVLSGKGSAVTDKWGFRIFSDTVFQTPRGVVPVDKFEVEVLPDLPPGGLVQLSDWLPNLKQLDFFKTLVQLGGLTVSCDPYEDHLSLAPSRTICDNVANARDWTAKRDAPDLPGGQARKVVYRYGSFGQKNYFKWADEPLHLVGYGGGPRLPDGLGYGDGVLLIDDTNLPQEYDLLTLPFAASEPSKEVPGLLRIPAYKVRENEDPFAEAEYDSVTAKPRLTLSSERLVRVVLLEERQVNGQPVTTTRTVDVPVSYFTDSDEEISLDAQTYVLPVNWRGLHAMLTECRNHSERYRLSAKDVADFLADPVRPIFDAVLKGYFSVSKISEFTASRPVEVEMLRLHPALLVAPTGIVRRGQEFFEDEFFVAPSGEFY